MSGAAIVLDACVLIPIRLTTTLLWLAEDGMFQPLWSQSILEEVERNLPKVGITPQQAERRLKFMRDAFDSEAMVDDFDDLIEDMTCDQKDRHVLATAVRADADGIMTFNVADFPERSVRPYGIEIVHPDQFLTQLLSTDPARVRGALERGVRTLRNPARSTTEFLSSLVVSVPIFANLAADDFDSTWRI